jgi:hypothetical protein
MAALAIWCGTYMDPNFIPAAYQELCDACELICENRSHRSGNVEVSCLYPLPEYSADDSDVIADPTIDRS